MRRFLLFLSLIFLLVGCSLPARATPTPAPDLLATIVAATMQAVASAVPPTPSLTPPPLPTETPQPPPTPGPGRVSGKACYREKGMIEMVLYFENVTTAQVFKEAVKAPKEVYSIELPPGTYKMYGWPPDYTVGVTVTGLEVVEITPGSFQPGVDFCDYSRGPYDVPYPPHFSPSKERGSISGTISNYGGGHGLTVVAFNQGTGYWYYVILMPGQLTFSIGGLPPGRYQVVAYDNLGATGGTQPEIYVLGGKDAKGDISSWGSGYPANPVR
jgi:hypothetical protein